MDQQLKDEFLTCPFCFKIYDHPKQLPCFHSLCDHCLKEFIQVQIGANPKRLTITCPVCDREVFKRSSLKKWPKDLWELVKTMPDNLYLSKLVERADVPGPPPVFYIFESRAEKSRPEMRKTMEVDEDASLSKMKQQGDDVHGLVNELKETFLQRREQSLEKVRGHFRKLKEGISEALRLREAKVIDLFEDRYKREETLLDSFLYDTDVYRNACKKISQEISQEDPSPTPKKKGFVEEFKLMAHWYRELEIDAKYFEGDVPQVTTNIERTFRNPEYDDIVDSDLVAMDRYDSYVNSLFPNLSQERTPTEKYWEKLRKMLRDRTRGQDLGRTEGRSSSMWQEEGKTGRMSRSGGQQEGEVRGRDNSREPEEEREGRRGESRRWGERSMEGREMSREQGRYSRGGQEEVEVRGRGCSREQEGERKEGRGESRRQDEGRTGGRERSRGQDNYSRGHEEANNMEVRNGTYGEDESKTAERDRSSGQDKTRSAVRNRSRGREKTRAETSPHSDGVHEARMDVSDSEKSDKREVKLAEPAQSGSAVWRDLRPDKNGKRPLYIHYGPPIPHYSWKILEPEQNGAGTEMPNATSETEDPPAPAANIRGSRWNSSRDSPRRWNRDMVETSSNASTDPKDPPPPVYIVQSRSDSARERPQRRTGRPRSEPLNTGPDEKDDPRPPPHLRPNALAQIKTTRPESTV